MACCRKGISESTTFRLVTGAVDTRDTKHLSNNPRVKFEAVGRDEDDIANSSSENHLVEDLFAVAIGSSTLHISDQ